jgi:hypothetical protein
LGELKLKVSRRWESTIDPDKMELCFSIISNLLSLLFLINSAKDSLKFLLIHCGFGFCSLKESHIWSFVSKDVREGKTYQMSASLLQIRSLLFLAMACIV